MMIGRDLVRLLQELVHVPEFRAIWKDLMLSPTEFKVPEFRDISQLYRVRTSSRYFLLRITPVMESQLRFLLSDVKFGNHRRKNYVEASVKLALFYDWLFFDEKVDNVMNIEPAFLLMEHKEDKNFEMEITLVGPESSVATYLVFVIA
ncbi:hypothetical protein ACET3Z_031770 [Daucus carota]